MLDKLIYFILISSTCATGLNITFLVAYLNKTCKNEPSCHLVDDPNLPPSRRTLLGRPCMCDVDCVMYRDCCTDSKYYNVLEQSRPPPFYCQPKYKVYMKATCPETWADEEIRSKCSLSTAELRCDDTSLIIPVVNATTNVTYANRYCAQCHDADADARPWDTSPSCGEAPAGLLDHLTTEVTPITTQPLLSPRPVRSAKKVDLRPRARTRHADAGPAYVTALLRYMRRKREIGIHVDFTKYARYANDIWKTARYDPVTGFFVARYQDKDIICRVSAKLSTKLRSHSRFCVPNVIEWCRNATDPHVDRQCLSHTSNVLNKRTNKSYRNRYCAQCDGAELDFLTGCPITVKDETPSSLNRLG